MNYQGKNVVITGASGGMGSVLCERLAEQGAKLSICSKNPQHLKALEEALSGKAEVFSKVVDITKEDEVAAFFEEAYAANGEFSALINLAGLSIPGEISQTEEATYDLMMDVNLKGTFLACKHFAAHAADAAIIINTGSIAARIANGVAPLYCTAKAAVNMLSQGILLQLASKNIRVTTINPGGTDTQFWGDRPVDRTKLMQPEDVADVLMFVLTANPNVQIHDIAFESIAKF